MSERLQHSLVLEQRKNIEINGVEDVLSFDESEVTLQTSCGGMTLEGEGLHIGILDVAEGHVKIDGKIDGIFYFDESQTQKKKLFGKR